MDKMKHVEKSQEGVPIWDGDASTFQEFEESSLVWEQSVAYHKRYLCGPKIVAELQGTARRFVLGKPPDWVSHQKGFGNLGLPQLPELTEHLTRFFKQGHRKRGENMNDYITRKTETYVRACQSLARVMGSCGGQTMSLQSPSTSHGHGPTGPWGRYVPSASGTQPSEQPQEEECQEVDEPASEASGDDPWASAAGTAGQRSASHSWWSSLAWNQGWRDDGWQSDWQWSQPSPQPATVELLPDTIEGWYLLRDAGLDTGESNMILASIKQDFSSHRVAQELRNQWSDEDLKRRDQIGKQSGWWLDDHDDLEEHYENAMVSTDDLNEEGVALMIAAQEEAEQAMSAFPHNGRTLREAREKQLCHDATSRPASRPTRIWKIKGHSGDTKSTCLKCGGDDRTSNCPRTSSTAASASVEESAPFICYADAGMADLEESHAATGQGRP